MALSKLLVAMLGLAAIGTAFYYGLDTGRWQVMGVGILAGVVFLVVAGWDEIATLKLGKGGVEVVKQAEAVTAKAEAALESLKQIAVLGAYGTQTSILNSLVGFEAKQEQHNQFLAELRRLGLHDSELVPIKERWRLWVGHIYRDALVAMLDRENFPENSSAQLLLDVWKPYRQVLTSSDLPDPKHFEGLEAELTTFKRPPGPRTKRRIEGYRAWHDRIELIDAKDVDTRQVWNWRE